MTPAKCLQENELLRMLAHVYKSNLCTGWGGGGEDFEREKPFTGTYNSLLVCRTENGVGKTTYPGYSFI